jgi:hypothetical protein
MRGGDISQPDPRDGIVCPTCFAMLAAEADIAFRWRFTTEDVQVKLPTVTRDGRIWGT